MKTPLPILLLLIAGNVSASGLGNQSIQMLRLLGEKDYGQARAMSTHIPPREAIIALTPAAERNNTNAQWMLAQAYWNAGDHLKAGLWSYTARMGTIIDSSTCARNDARNFESALAYPYKPIMDWVRRDPIVEQQAVLFAANHYIKSYHHYQDPTWTCRTWAYTMNHTEKISDIRPEKEWTGLRFRSMSELLRKSGLGRMVPKETSVNETDPLKRSFGEAW